MESRLLRRPTIELLSGRLQCLLTLNTNSRRHESSYRRTKKRLNVRPDPSFLLSKDSPQQDHIIFNPPSSAPSVFHTPLKFLPKEDKRRQLFADLTSNPDTRLPPTIDGRPVMEKKYHLSDLEIREIQRLGAEDPNKWTTSKLARKFNCSGTFIALCRSDTPKSEAYVERRRLLQVKIQAGRDRWGPRRRMAREDRQKRKELVLKDQ